jgi:DNA repair protein RadC
MVGTVEIAAPRRAIKDWSPEERPRERMVTHRPASLSQAELLAILIRNGSRKHSALEIARLLLDRYGNLHTIGKCTPGDLMKVPGIGLAKATTIIAALELGRRQREEPPPERHFIRSSRESANYARPWLGHLPYEAFAVMYLVQAGWVKAFDLVSNGGISSTTVDSRLILKRALEENAVSLIVFHNHPSGSLRPSKSDEQLTQKLSQAARTMDIKLLDHVIIGEGGHFSFADEGLLG